MCISTAGAFDTRAMFVSFGMPASTTGCYDSDNPEEEIPSVYCSIK